MIDIVGLSAALAFPEAYIGTRPTAAERLGYVATSPAAEPPRLDLRRSRTPDRGGLASNRWRRERVSPCVSMVRTDEDLVRGLTGSASDASLRALYRAHGGAIYGYALRR